LITIARGSGFSKPSNPLIADVLYRCNLIEKWGRGVPIIISSCKAANDPEPEFIADKLEFIVTFMFPAPLKPPVIFLGEQPQQMTQKTGIIQ
jgi:predicted HTH transcriptional regulator